MVGELRNRDTSAMLRLMLLRHAKTEKPKEA